MAPTEADPSKLRDTSRSDTMTPESATPDTAVLTVHPSVVFKLGADLITDDVQALTELVKNAYDADSRHVNVTIDTRTRFLLRTGEHVTEDLAGTEDTGEGAAADQQSRSFRSGIVQGAITIADAGDGMRRHEIVNGWLTVSASQKGAMKAAHETTGTEKRTPLGDKGLGRLGAQRLGQSLTLTTIPRLQPGETRVDAPAHRITIIWADFEAVSSLTAVPLLIEPVTAGDEAHGSTVEIRGLRELDQWRTHGGSPSVALERDLSTMISPYDLPNGFKVRLRIDDDVVDLRQRARAVLKKSTVSYKLDYRDGTLKVEAEAATSYAEPPQGAQDIADFDQLVTQDNGYKFLSWLMETRPSLVADLGFQHGDDQRFCFASAEFNLDDLDPERHPPRTPDQQPDDADHEGPPAAIDPGPFRGEVDQVILRNDPTSGSFDSRSEYREFVKVLNGIRVYRDGFGVRVSEDWLDLAEQWSSGRSWYTLRPDNVLGHIDLSARDNAALEETTNREAFRETPAYRNFMRLLGAWLSYGSKFQAGIRRGYLEYKKVMLSRAVNLPASTSPPEVAKRIRAQAVQIEASARNLARAKDQVDDLSGFRGRLEERRTDLEQDLFANQGAADALSRAAADIAAVQNDVSAAVQVAMDEVASFQQERAMLDLLVHQLELQETQLREVWESIALGLVAESLSHEVLNVADRLRARSAQILTYLSSLPKRDKRVWSFAEDTRSTAVALAKQVSRLDPSLRYVRDRRDRIQMSDFVVDLAAYYQDRWSDQLVDVTAEIVSDFSVRMNTGRLQQVLDNLILNSHYWTTRAVREARIDRGRITITANAPRLIVEDNGPGIDATVEHMLFDPFVTLRPSQQGRGLGLYIARQLLDADHATLDLLPGRNQDGKLYAFALDFSGTDR